MKIDEIYSLEQNNVACIHLVRDRLFWQAWEKSAFHFIKLFRPYKVHSRFVQKISAEQVWLGFPKSNLELFEREAVDSGLVWTVVDENRIDIAGFEAMDGFDSWKEGILQSHNSGVAPKDASATSGAVERVMEKTPCILDEKNLLQMYRISYDFSLYACRLMSKVAKVYRFGLADRLREHAYELVERLHLGVNRLAAVDRDYVILLVSRIRIKMRLLHDLQQISTKQWIFMNRQMEDICNYIGRSPQVQGPVECA